MFRKVALLGVVKGCQELFGGFLGDGFLLSLETEVEKVSRLSLFLHREEAEEMVKSNYCCLHACIIVFNATVMSM